MAIGVKGFRARSEDTAIGEASFSTRAGPIARHGRGVVLAVQRLFGAT
jgi:hypothetical protein